MPQSVEQAIRANPLLRLYLFLGAKHGYQGENWPGIDSLDEAARYLYLDAYKRSAQAHTKH